MTTGTDRPLFRVFSKGTTAEGTDIRRSANWAVARRGWLRVFSDRLQMGNWTIRYSVIQQATLFRLRTFLGGYVLRVTTPTETYQFGMNPWALFRRSLPFPHDVQDTRVQHTPFTIIIRIIALTLLLLWALQRFWS